MLLSCNFPKETNYFFFDILNTIAEQHSCTRPLNVCLVTLQYHFWLQSQSKSVTQSFFMNTVGVYYLLSEIIIFVFTFKDRAMFDLIISLAIFPEFLTFILKASSIRAWFAFKLIF